VLSYEFNEGDSILVDVDKEKNLVLKGEKRRKAAAPKAEPEIEVAVVA
jgi:hypothetical protein